MKFKIGVLIGLFSLLFGCSDRESLGGHYYFNGKTHSIEYRYVVGGALLPSYKTVPTLYPKSFKVLSNEHAIDKENLFYAGALVKDAQPKGFQVDKHYPITFGINRQHKQVVYKGELIELDSKTAKIHSTFYISDHQKVLYANINNNPKFEDFYTVPVKDISSFKALNPNQYNNSKIGYDQHTIYIGNIDTKIASKEAKLFKRKPIVLLQDDALHLIYSYYRNREPIKKQLPTPFDVIDNGLIGEFLYDSFYHFKIVGWKNAQRIKNSDWIIDDNGLYYINESKIIVASKSKPQHIDFDEKYPKQIKTDDSLIYLTTYPERIDRFSLNAKTVDRDVIIDDDKVFYEGKEIKNIDIKTFVKLPKSTGFVDKNFFYGSGFYYKKPIPHWAYDAFLNGMNERDLFGIDMKYTHTVYHTYWNGFSVAVSMPTEQNESNTILLEFKNIERKTIKLKRPLEEQLYITYKPYDAKSPVFYNDETAVLVKQNEYDFSKIKNDEIIKFSLAPNQKMIEQLTTEINGNLRQPELILSDIELVLERTDYNLYIETSFK